MIKKSELPVGHPSCRVYFPFSNDGIAHEACYVVPFDCLGIFLCKLFFKFPDLEVHVESSHDIADDYLVIKELSADEP